MTKQAKRQAKRAVVWGELLWDLFPDKPRLGGAPANVAFHLARLGANVTLVTRVGDDEQGDEAVRQLLRAGVDTSLVQRDPDHPTGAVEVDLDAGEARYKLVADRAWQYLECTDAVRAAVGRADALCFGSLAQVCASRPGAFEVVAAAAPAACFRICDVNLRRPFDDAATVREILARANVVKVNADEAAFLESEFQITSLADWMVGECGVDLVAVTRGPAGARITAHGEHCDHPGHRASPGGDNVGAGDAFVAVLTVGLLRGWSTAHINRAANRYACAVASARGATPQFAADDIERWIAGDS